MMKKGRKRIFLILAAAFGVLLSGCGCGQERDPMEEQVIELSITSIPSPTPEPESEKINPDAVVTNDGITIINEYTKNRGFEETEEGSGE